MSDNSNTIYLSVYDKISTTITQAIAQAQSSGNGGCVMIRGSAGCGKSHFAVANVLEASPYIDQDGIHVPRCLVPIPSEITLIQLLRSILIALGEPIIPIWHGALPNNINYPQSELDGLVHRVIDVIQLVDVEYIIFDDFHYLDMVGGEKDIKLLMEILFEIINRSGKCFVLMGLPEKMNKLMSMSLRLRLVSSTVDFEPFSIDWNNKHLFENQISEFDKFVSQVADLVGIRFTQRTKHEKLLQRIYLATNGFIGNLINLFIFAEGRAKQQEQSVVNLDTLAWAYNIRLKSSESTNKNPFKRTFDTQIYDVPNINSTVPLGSSVQIDTTLSTPRFVRQINPYADETIISWLVRIVSACRYPNLDFVLKFLRYALDLAYLTVQQINFGRVPEVTNLLSDLGNIPIEIVSALSLEDIYSNLNQHRLNESKSNNEFNLFSALVNKHPRACPICLHEEIYIRQKWHLDSYCICETHGTWMIDACLNCGEIYEIEDIFRDCCSECGSRFSTNTVSLADISRSLTNQNKIINWIENGEHQLPELAEKSFDTIMIVVYGLVDSVARQQYPDTHCTTAMKANLYEVAMKVIEDPLTYFHVYLYEYRNNQSQTEQYGFEAEFGILYSKWLIGYWASADFDFIHDAFNQYVYSEFVPYDGITNAKWLHLYPDFWNKSDFISVQSAVKQNRALKLSKLLLAIHAQELQLHVAPDSYSQYIRKSDLRRFILNIDFLGGWK